MGLCHFFSLDSEHLVQFFFRAGFGSCVELVQDVEIISCFHGEAILKVLNVDKLGDVSSAALRGNQLTNAVNVLEEACTLLSLS